MVNQKELFDKKKGPPSTIPFQTNKPTKPNNLFAYTNFIFSCMKFDVRLLFFCNILYTLFPYPLIFFLNIELDITNNPLTGKVQADQRFVCIYIATRANTSSFSPVFNNCK